MEGIETIYAYHPNLRCFPVAPLQLTIFVPLLIDFRDFGDREAKPSDANEESSGSVLQRFVGVQKVCPRHLDF